MPVQKIFLKPVLILFISHMYCLYSYGQFYNTGSAPPSVRWKTLKTERFKLIFPEESLNASLGFSRFLYNTMDKNGEWYDSARPKPINIILYNQNIMSNAYVSLGPRRMELISTPPQDGYAQDWLEQLALHEYKHVIQLHALEQGFTKVLCRLTGDLGNGVPVAFLPLWFIEGDAVLFETAVSSAGRGREPDFMKGIKSIELQCPKRLTYDQAYLGTYNGYAPDHYSYGYQMVSWTNLNFGTDVFNQVLKNVAKRPFTLAPFYFGLKKTTGLSKENIYINTCNHLNKTWSEDRLKKGKLTMSYQIATEYKSDYSSYRFAYIDSYDSIIALRTSIDDNAKFVKIKDGNEKVLAPIGLFKGSQVGYSNRYIAWENLNYNTRWEQVKYSNIKIYDRFTKLSFVLQKKSRHFSPSISKDETLIAVINNTPDYLSKIEIFNIESRVKQKGFLHPDSLQLSNNSWIDNENIAVVASGGSGKAIYQLNIRNGTWKKIFGPTFHNITSLNVHDSNILFTYTLDGAQNIYFLDVSDGEVVRLTNSEIAADFGTMDKNGQLFYSDYSYRGYKIKTFDPSLKSPTKLVDIAPYKHVFADTFARIINFNTQDTVFGQFDFEIEKYSKIKHAVNIHSWIVPLYIDVNNLEHLNNPGDLIENTYPGLSLFSQNILSTLTSSMGYYYKDGHNHFRPVLKYTGLLPVITFDMDWGGKPRYVKDFDTIISSHPVSNPNIELGLDVHVPLNFSTARKLMTIRPGFDFNFRNLTVVSNRIHQSFPLIDSLTGVYYYKNISTGNIYSNFYISSRKSMKDIYPKWGLSIYLSMLKASNSIPYKQIYESNVAIANVYTPGLFRHHSIKLIFAHEKGLRRRLALPRGYARNDINFNWIYISQKSSVTYTMPLLYPDLSVGPIAYFKRVHCSGYFDYMRFKGTEYLTNNQREISKAYSFGFELGVETHLLRFFWPVTPIFRLSYLPVENKPVPEFYISASYIF